MEQPDPFKNQGNTSDHVFKQLIEQIKKSLLTNYPNAVKLGQGGQYKLVQIEELQRIMNDRITQTSVPSKGRGGNNVAENMKKSIIGVFKRRLGSALFEEYEQRYIKPYEMKSQKQNFILYFLFLQQFLFQRKISEQIFEQIKSQVIAKIQKYARNSEMRKADDPQREEFHEKNLTQFRKYLQIDLDFCKPRSYLQIRQWIRGQYLKKKVVFLQAEKKVRRIIERHPLISKVFTDLETQVKIEGTSQNQEASSSSNASIKSGKSQSS